MGQATTGQTMKGVNMFESAFVREYIQRDMYHGVSRSCAKQRAILTEKLNARQISTQEYHRQMDSVHAQYPGDWQKIQAAR
jgi:bacterioferritin (cytochrome b1)